MLQDSLRRIDPTLHHFVGFPDRQEDPTHPLRWLHQRLSDAPPVIQVVHDALFAPPAFDRPDMWASGGIMTADGILLPLVRERWEGREEFLGLTEAEPAEPASTIDGDAIYLGWLFESFGHFLLESVARLWALPHLPPDLPVLFHFHAGVTPGEHLFELLEIFGVARERIILPQAPVRVRRLLMPEALVLSKTIVHERAGEPYRAVAARLPGDAPMSDQPLYLSRRLVGAGQREVIGEEILEGILREHGWLVVSPETLPVAEQIRLAATHRVLMTTTGSASHLGFFARPGAEMHILCYPNLLEHHIVTSEVAALPTWYLNVLRGARHPVTALAIDLRATISHLIAAGLLPPGALAADLPASLESSPAFEEAWLFGLYIRWWDGIPPHLVAHAATLRDRLRPSAWPVFVAMATLPPDRISDAEADDAMQRYAAALANERDELRLLRHQEIVQRILPNALRRCSPTTRDLALSVTGRVLLARAAASNP
jgi:hypothetical protein